ncbi:MAG: DUF4065 domain-containing protein [Alphaproteobacteria bacterium]|nr:DUF4065 domain-containing protein [Alphaproteobacteria bacterium]
MIDAKDVAQYILEKTGELTGIKLQKLCYYSQAWSLVWDDNSLFDNRIEAWIGGPVIPDLWHCHKGVYKVDTSTFGGDSSKLQESQRNTIDKVIEYYMQFSSHQLSDITHQEYPWIRARKGLPSNVRGSNVIDNATMSQYYSSIFEDG